MKGWSAARNSPVADISVPIEDVAGAISKIRVSSATQSLLTLIPWQVLLCKGIITSIGVSCASKHLLLYMDLSWGKKGNTLLIAPIAEILWMRQESFTVYCKVVTTIKRLTLIEFNISSSFCCNCISFLLLQQYDLCNLINNFWRNISKSCYNFVSDSSCNIIGSFYSNILSNFCCDVIKNFCWSFNTTSLAASAAISSTTFVAISS